MAMATRRVRKHPGARRRKHCQRWVARSCAEPAVRERMVPVAESVKLQVLCAGDETHSQAKSESEQLFPPLVFVHGSYHAAWCYAEHFLPFFASRGFSAYSVSLRGQGKSSVGELTESGAAGTLDTFCDDVAAFAQTLHAPPVLIVHSFGGLIAQRYMQQRYSPQLAGVVFLASVPTTGSQNVAIRILLKQPLKALLITWTFIRKSFVSSKRLARLAFFSDDLPEEKVEHYMAQLAESSRVKLLDLPSLSQQYLPLMPPPKEDMPPIKVIAAADDNVVDLQSQYDLAQTYGTECEVIEHLAHDVMLDTRWEQCATSIAHFIDACVTR